MIRNPVLTGFHPDPSICRVGEDYYLATSTFEWFPGVRLHHSRDLRSWRPIGSALTDPAHLDLRGCQNSGGVWAPCLTHADGRFWLVFTNVRHHAMGVTIDSPNYLTTAEDIRGPWSTPVYLNSHGFDPSLFHDDDGRKYIVQMQTGEPVPARRFDGILLQELDPESLRLKGEPERIWDGSPIGITEGPHLYRRGGFYYLLTAEGGTAARHAVSICRSRSIRGPWELHPANPILTSFQKPQLALWSAGHGCLVDTPQGEWFMAHLCQRPLQRPGRLVLDREANKSVPLGRETAIQAIRWTDDGWPVLAHGDNSPRVEVPCGLPVATPLETSIRADFSRGGLPEEFCTLREPPAPDWFSFERTPGCLSLRGRDSLASTFDQSLVARRLCHHHARITVRLRFAPRHQKQAAGLVGYYDRLHNHSFRISALSPELATLGIVSWEHDKSSRLEVATLPLQTTAAGVELRAEIDRTSLRFLWRTGSEAWIAVDREFEATALGDWVSPISAFTGSFWGFGVQDLADRSAWADFEWFDYEPL